jgi:molecular chaperone DnaK
MTYEVEKNAKEWSDKLPGDLKTRLEASVERARKALRGDDLNEIRAAQEELSTTFGEAGQSFYAQNQGSPSGDAAGADAGSPQGDGAPAGAPADDVVEADYEIVDDAKK